LACPPRAAHRHHSARWLRLTCAAAPTPAGRAQARYSRGPPRCAPNCAGHRSSSPSAGERGGGRGGVRGARLPRREGPRVCTCVGVYACLVGAAHHRPEEHPGAVAVGAHLAAVAGRTFLTRRARGGAVVRAARVVCLAVEPPVADHVRSVQWVGTKSVVELRARPRRGDWCLRVPCGQAARRGGPCCGALARGASARRERTAGSGRRTGRVRSAGTRSLVIR